VLTRAAVKWNADDCLTLGAALAYYSVFSLAPILVIVIAVAGALFGPEAAQGELVGQIRDLVGDEGAAAIQGLIQSASRQGTGSRATVIGLIVLLFGSTSAFSQLQSALNRVWDVPPASHGGLMPMIRARLWSFAAVLGVGFLLSVSLVLSAAAAALSRYGSGWMPGISGVLLLTEITGSLIVHTLLFAMIFRLLPDTPIRWRDVWVGAAVTAALFYVGKLAIGVYLGRSQIGAAYGAAAWIILILAWVYYSAQIILFGAEFTRAFATRGTSAPHPTLSPEGRGMPSSPTSPRSRPPRA
jgi:membrane protein